MPPSEKDCGWGSHAQGMGGERGLLSAASVVTLEHDGTVVRTEDRTGCFDSGGAPWTV